MFCIKDNCVLIKMCFKIYKFALIRTIWFVCNFGVELTLPSNKTVFTEGTI